MEPLGGCGNSLVVLIETQEGDWSWIYSIVEKVTHSSANEPHSHPIPFGTEITDHINRKMDVITITGAFGCLRCPSGTVGEFASPDVIIPGLKRLKERMIYNVDDFATLISNHWLARSMILTNYTVEESQEHVHTKLVTTTWLGANLTGTIRNPDFQRGGIVF